MCDQSQRGSFIVPQDEENKSSIFTHAFDLRKSDTADPEIALYKVEETGYYCVAILPSNPGNGTAAYFDSWIEMKMPYGNLPASDYPKLLFYGIFALIYLCVGLFWAVQSYRYWQDILPVQHFLSGTIFFLTVEMAVNWGFWEAYNQTGSASLLSAGRNSMSFFMLLVVCMGYSVVKPSLGSTMKRCVILALTHFFFGVVYSLGVMLLSPETAGFLVLLVIFPLAITMSAFYVWIFSSLTATIQTLEMRKQHVKVLMYKRVHRLLIFSVIMVVVIFILNMFGFSGRNEVDWAANSWKWRWIMLDGLLNVLYFAVFFIIILLWRPTNNNQRYGLQQISQDEEEAMDLENQLQHSEGLGSRSNHPHGRGMEDETAIFEVGDDDLSDDDHDKVRLVSVSGRKSADRSHHHHQQQQQQQQQENGSSSSPPAYTEHRATANTRDNNESNTLLNRQDDTDDDDDDDQ
ncbi:lung seven transmembrane receptor-domain-containing protein [Zychaea mexicana]|uniref:lung seven transmembrane receptor-domain-containing protein n=1 Tax=Zychaea mexicana TaxID=64656 RepID=UPI0022FE4217|nr:lung seven transmembrane receptor-domain-containing protein [Zychaea mexicana]KAI9474869.1 lung seven transmembrane receptor-domain-containing protein [Zychaea mexicana]